MYVPPPSRHPMAAKKSPKALRFGTLYGPWISTTEELSEELQQLLVGILDGQNRQSPIASVQRTRSTLASHSAVPRGTNVKRMNANRAIRIAAQRT